MYIKNSIQSVFIPAQGAWLLAGLDQHIFIEETDPERIRAKYWPWFLDWCAGCITYLWATGYRTRFG